MITFNASARYGCSGQYIAHITGRDAKFTFNRQFIGRKSGKRNEDTKADVDEPGLYEECDVTTKGKDSTFWVAVKSGPESLAAFRIDKSEAMKIAKELDSRSFDDVIEYVAGYEKLTAKIEQIEKALADSANKDQDEMLTLATVSAGLPVGTQITRRGLSDVRRANLAKAQQEIAEAKLAGLAAESSWKFRTAKETAKKQEAVNVESAVAACWSAIQALPEKQMKEVLKQLKLKVSPKDEAAADLITETAEMQPAS